MSREKAAYRDVLEQLSGAFPGRGALKQAEVAQFMGVDARTVRRWVASGRLRWPKDLPTITMADLARQVCG